MSSGNPVDYQRLFEQAPGLFLVLSAGEPFTILGASDAYLRATMTERAAIIGRGLFDVFPDNPDDATATGTNNLRASLHRVLTSGKPDTMAVQKYDIRRPESEGGGFEVRHWSPVNSPVSTSGGTVDFIIHRVEDVTDLVRAKELHTEQSEELERRNVNMKLEVVQRSQELDAANKQLRLANRQLAASLEDRDRMFNLSLDMLCVAGFDGFFKEVNPSFQRVLGWTTDELTSKPFMDFVHPDDRDATTQAMSGLLSGIPVEDFENRYLCRNGSYKTICWSSFPLPETGTIYAMARDVTERKGMERRLHEMNQELADRATLLDAANKELEAFSYSVSHDLRAPLRHIDGFIQLLRQFAVKQLDDKNRRYLGIIEDSARQMGILIDELLSFSRMSRTVLLWTQVNLEAMVRETIGQLEAECQGRRIQWTVDQLPPVVGDGSMLKQVIVNLIGNAVKYSQHKTDAHIEIRSLEPMRPELEGHTIIAVRDNGAGFDMQYADKLFGVFQRLHSANEFEGVGIGLANVRRIISRHGGQTWAEGRVGEGATFYFSLPHTTILQHKEPS